MTLTLPDHELSDSEIEARYGRLLAEGVAAFRTDPNYICEVAEAAARSKVKNAEGRRREDEVGALLAEGYTVKEISKRTGRAVSSVQYSAKCYRERIELTDGRSSARPNPKPELLKKKSPSTPAAVERRRVQAERVAAVLQLLDDGIPIKEVADRFGCTYGNIWHLRKKHGHGPVSEAS